MDKDSKYMRMALEMAAKALDGTYPNPMVGAVILKKGRIIGKGYHPKAGADHAEIAAIKNSRGSLSGAEMYVTLEPCTHYGKTPPCVPSIIESGISRVVVATLDPNPITKGRGIKALRKAGISVEIGPCEAEAKRLNRKYIKYITTGLPYITAKLAQSLDGKTAARDGSSKWITSESARKYAKKMRSSYDAIVVGANTVVKDDPMLMGAEKNRPPFRVVLDSSLRLPEASRIVRSARATPLILGTTELAPKNRLKRFNGIDGVEVITVKSRKGKVSLRPFFKRLAEKGIVNILVEGGGELIGSLMDEALVDEWLIYIAPRILGGENTSVKGLGVPNIQSSLDLLDVTCEKIGDDILIKGLSCNGPAY